MNFDQSILESGSKEHSSECEKLGSDMNHSDITDLVTG